MSVTVIETRGLAKRYGRRGALALDGVDLEVVEGEVFGFLGPNGAGKTTMIRLLLDLIRPTRGECRVFGSVPRTGGPELRRRVGYLPGELPFSGRQTSQELLTFLGNLRGGVAREQVQVLADRFVLDLSQPIRTLSKGNKQKLGIVQAFMHEPELMILDEPSSGLDPLLQREFLDLAREQRSHGRTIFMSSHILSEVQDIADRIGILREGRLLSIQDVAAARETAPRRVEIVFAEAVSVKAFASVPGIRDAKVDGRTLRCVIEGEADALVKAVSKYHVVSLVAEPPDLEEAFLSFYSEGE